MEKSPTTAACHLEPVFQEPVGILILFTILTWSISKLQRFLPSSCHSCSSPLAKTTSTPILADRKTCKALNENEDDEMELTHADAEVVMRNIGLNFDQESNVVFKSICSDYISQLFDDDEPSLQEVKKAFLVFDENNDGYIDASDLHRVLQNLGLGEGVGVNACEHMIARYDMNKDRRIDIVEFTKVLEASIC